MESERESNREAEENAIEALMDIQVKELQQGNIGTLSSVALDNEDDEEPIYDRHEEEEASQQEEDEISRIENEEETEDREGYFEENKEYLQSARFTFQEGISPQGGGGSTSSSKTETQGRGPREYKIKIECLQKDFRRREEVQKMTQDKVPFIHKRYDLLKKP